MLDVSWIIRILINNNVQSYAHICEVTSVRFGMVVAKMPDPT